MELKTAELYKSFGEKAVLRGVSFSVTGGRALGILGRNGAGKTTTIRIIMQVFSPDSGEVLLDGQPMVPGKVKIGYLPEERGMYPKKSVMQQLLYFGMLAGLKKREAAANADRLLERLEQWYYLSVKYQRQTVVLHSVVALSDDEQHPVPRTECTEPLQRTGRSGIHSLRFGPYGYGSYGRSPGCHCLSLYPEQLR